MPETDKQDATVEAPESVGTGKPVVETEKPKEPTVAEAMAEKSEQKTVPEAAFLSEKKARKQLEKQVKELQTLVEEGATAKEVSEAMESIDELGDEYQVDKGFLKKLTKSIRAEVAKEFGDKLKPFEEKDRQERLNKVFSEHFDKTLAEMPQEYEGVVNKEVIKALSLLPENKNKTFSQLIEDTYSNAISGKRTLEKATPRGGKSPETIDMHLARTNKEYFKEIMADPVLKAKYNSEALKRLPL